MLSRSSVTKSNLGPRVYLKVAKTLSPLCYSPPHRNKRKVFSVQPTSSIPILLIMLSGQHRCTSVQLLVSIGHPLCQCKISLPTQVHMFSIRRSRLYTSVCTIHVSMSCCRRWCLRKRNTINVNRIVVSYRIR